MCINTDNVTCKKKKKEKKKNYYSLSMEYWARKPSTVTSRVGGWGLMENRKFDSFHHCLNVSSAYEKQQIHPVRFQVHMVLHIVLHLVY
jgi:hypothetical protein